jgi:hypothetical protein
MARIVSLIQFTGRAGSAVGSKGKGGKVLLRQYQPSVANPCTDAQMSQRAKIKLASQVASMLGEVGRTSLIANGNKKTDRGLLVKRLLKGIVVNQDGSQASLQYDLQLVDNPTYNEAVSLTVNKTADAFVAIFSGPEEGVAIAKCIMVHDLATGLWRHTAILNAATSLSLATSASEEGHALEVFAYGIVMAPKTADGLTSLTPTGANSAGFILDLNKVSTTNFVFSPAISAALAVEGNGTTSGGTASSGGSSTSGGTSNGGTSNGDNNGGSSNGGTTGGDNNGENGGSNGGNSQSETPTVAAPTISGTSPFEETTEVTMSAESGAEIRYTTDGSTPTAESSLYSSALTLSDTTTVKAIAIKDGVSSTVASQTFTKGTGEGYGDTN